MPKKQKVRFSKGDRRPRHDSDYPKLSYEKKIKKIGRKLVWQVFEKPTNKVIAEYFFEEDAQKLIDFQNKHRVWESNGGIPSFLYVRA